MLGFSLKLLGLASLFLCSTAVYCAPNVLVSVSPLQGLVTNLMQGVGKPTLLLDDGIDLHHFSYKPSDINKLHSAQLLVWIGEGFEPDLPSYIENGIVSGASLELTKVIPKKWVLPLEEHSGGYLTDPHLWLSPSTMNKAIDAISDSLVELDPANAALYKANLKTISNKLENLSESMINELKPYQKEPFAVYHNAYAYLIREAGLQQPLALESSVHGQLSLNRLHHLVETAAHRPKCVAVSNLDPVSKLKRVMKTLDVKVVELNRVGEGNYFNAMQQLTQDFAQCFTR